jgi:PAS domain S-box-containing protein
MTRDSGRATPSDPDETPQETVGSHPIGTDVIDCIELPILVVNRDCILVSFNPAAARLLSLAPPDVGRTLRGIPILADMKDLKEVCEHVITGGASSHWNVRDGAGSWFSLRIGPCRASNRHISGAVLTLTNVTALRASLEQAVDEREYTKAIINTVIDPLVVLDAEFRIQAANQAFFAMFQASREVTRQARFHDLMGHSWDSLRLQTLLSATRRDGQAESIEIEHELPTLGRRTLLLNARHLSRVGHRPPMVLVAIQDITERKRAEVELETARKAAERRARQATMAAEIGVAFTRSDGELHEVLATCCQSIVHHFDAVSAEIWIKDQDSADLVREASAGRSTGIDGAPERRSIGRSQVELVAQERRPHFTNDVVHDLHIGDPDWARSEGIVAFAGYPLVLQDRLIGVFAIFASHPLVDDALDTLGTVADTIAVGIERKRAASDRERIVEELRETVRLNEIFAGVLAHDLRNPLAAIVTAADILQMLMRGREETSKPLARIVTSGRRMARMIEQVMDFTRIRQGAGIQPTVERCDLAEISRQMMDELGHANPGWELRLELLGDPDGHWDRGLLSQVVSNLVGNALQHGRPEGGLRLRIDGSSSSRVILQVDNAGVIDPALLPDIFDAFREGSSRYGRSTGLGLGLFITKHFVEAHGGSVGVVSAAESTSFTVDLPRHPQHRSGSRLA